MEIKSEIFPHRGYLATKELVLMMKLNLVRKILLPVTTSKLVNFKKK